MPDYWVLTTNSAGQTCRFCKWSTRAGLRPGVSCLMVGSRFKIFVLIFAISALSGIIHNLTHMKAKIQFGYSCPLNIPT